MPKTRPIGASTARELTIKVHSPGSSLERTVIDGNASGFSPQHVEVADDTIYKGIRAPC